MKADERREAAAKKAASRHAAPVVEDRSDNAVIAPAPVADPAPSDNGVITEVTDGDACVDESAGDNAVITQSPGESDAAAVPAAVSPWRQRLIIFPDDRGSVG
ncbi:hypothetical protein ACWGLP_18845 [Streptomyces lydicus]